MREIKFRAWVVNSAVKEMHYSDEIQINSANAKAFQLRVGFEDAFPEKNNIEQWQKDIVWMQYTGLKDKNGKEIYEGDILKVYDWSLVPKFLGYGSIVWDKDETGWNLTNMNIEDRYDFIRCFPNSEIVGNIYENPELIK